MKCDFKEKEFPPWTAKKRIVHQKETWPGSPAGIEKVTPKYPPWRGFKWTFK